MFSKVLVANRGAIAVRIIRTLRDLGVASVAVYAESDAESLHVRLADEAWCLGAGGASDTYLDMERLLEIARASGAEAIHPGYGFLSENADFVERCETEGIAFMGPTADQMRAFGLKHSARELARRADVPLCPGSGLLADVEEACRFAHGVGYPVMLKSTAGGGGIGMKVCEDEQGLREAFDSVRRLGTNNFANDGVFLEKFVAQARHIEVQVFGDGRGAVLAIGERDCSSQRRNQKVMEECPAPHLSDEQRRQLHETAERLLASVDYRSAGTVEFILDAQSGDYYFLEVNTRLQVEHGVTEEVYGVDLVRWMVELAAGVPVDLVAARSSLSPRGHAIQVRLYAEDPFRQFQPCPGLLTEVHFPSGPHVRVDHWIEAGVEVPPWFDPMLAKVIIHGRDRAAALARLEGVLRETRLYGTETNLQWLRALVADPVVREATVTTRYLDGFRWSPARMDVLRPGTQTTIQDYPGRTGYWHVGVPPSGPFDTVSFRLGNRLLGNAPECAGLEITAEGPALRFSCATRIALCGAECSLTLDDEPVPCWSEIEVAAGQVLSIGRLNGPGARTYLCVAGGIQCPDYLGSRSTFTLGQFGGHNGRALRAGDVLHLDGGKCPPPPRNLPPLKPPALGTEWALRVIYGPHGAPDFLTEADIATFFSTDWEVHYNSSRTGIRLNGPKPAWARADGGEAGLHPSNIHDNAYAFGTVDFTGDMPVILGPDGPSLGGFVCPATVIQADLWKLGQLRAGDRVRFVPVSVAQAVELEAAQAAAIDRLEALEKPAEPEKLVSPVVRRDPAGPAGEEVCYRVAGDHFLLVEYGAQVLDLRLRFRVHALMGWLEEHPLAGLRELTPGIRSLQIHYDSQAVTLHRLLDHLRRAEQELSQQIHTLSVPSRIVHLPLSWDDEACQRAVDRYMQSVREDAPWCPSNLEFIRRINGLDDVDAVKEILFSASYLVMGLGDVYLGAPVATPVDPRHRLVTTKYNPARTWTAENSVGIGGSYLCIYGMEGPGGYQFVGRTLQMWNRYRQTREFPQPWLLRFFDQIRFYEVSHDELEKIRREFPLGRYPLRIEHTEFRLGDYEAFLSAHEHEIDAFRERRASAFSEELARWHASGQFHFEPPAPAAPTAESDWDADCIPVDSPVAGSVWQLAVKEGDRVATGAPLMVLESMKMEIPLQAPCSGTVVALLQREGGRVSAGQPLVVLREAEDG